ncbi:Protein of unknown function [Gryllus bimaculatus]|nr:Protein of unknown function [Gryllus bimaculatus]
MDVLSMKRLCPAVSKRQLGLVDYRVRLFTINGFPCSSNSSAHRLTSFPKEGGRAGRRFGDRRRSGGGDGVADGRTCQGSGAALRDAGRKPSTRGRVRWQQLRGGGGAGQGPPSGRLAHTAAARAALLPLPSPPLATPIPGEQVALRPAGDEPGPFATRRVLHSPHCGLQLGANGQR